MDQNIDPPDRAYSFGVFRLEPSRRLLQKSGEPVALNSRAFDILVALLEARDRVLTRAELLSRVWPGLVVDEHNLSVQISTLRRVLGGSGLEPGLIATVPGRGYRFVGNLADDPVATGLPPERRPAPTVVSDPETSKLTEESWPASRWPRYAFASGAVCGALLVAFAWLGWPFRSSAPAPVLSVVVMPFDNLGGDRSKDYLSDAVSDDLTAALGRIPGSRVTGRQTAMAFKAKHALPADVGKALHVRYMVTGSVEAEAQKLRVNVWLTETATGKQTPFPITLTGESELLNTQEQIVDLIASALGPELVFLAAKRSIVERPDNADALDLLLRARSILDRDDGPLGRDAAQPLLEKAIAKNPNFPEALSALAKLLLDRVNWADGPDVSDRKRAQELVSKALAIAPSEPDTLIAQATLEVAQGEYVAAQATYEKALLIYPNSGEALAGESNCALVNGDAATAADLTRQAIRIDPLNSHIARRYSQLGHASLLLGRYSDAIEWLKRAGVADQEQDAGSNFARPQEFESLYLIAANQLAGSKKHAASLYAVYAQTFPRRTIWRMASYFQKREAESPGFKSFVRALQDVGMPMFAPEDVDDHVAISWDSKGDFDPTPLDPPPGIIRITTKEVAQLLQREHDALVIDVSQGADVLPRAQWIATKGLTDSPESAVESVVRKLNPASEQQILLVGDGPYGMASLRAALHLRSLLYRHVFWYRGGEEAWSAAELTKVDDRRQ